MPGSRHCCAGTASSWARSRHRRSRATLRWKRTACGLRWIATGYGRLLIQNPQRIYSIQVIYETVWNEPYYYVSNGTVMVHIRNLRMKVEDDPQKPARICTVWGKGYRFAAGEEGRL